VRVSGVRVECGDAELESMLSAFGELSAVDRYESKDGGETQVVYVRYSSAECAQEAAKKIDGMLLPPQQTPLKAERIMDKPRRQPREQHDGSPRGRKPTGGPARHAEFPLRILVASDLVGAVIGRKGATIRAITQSSRARVDVHRKDNAGSLEKAITIYGNPENCTSACKRILEVMRDEYEATNKTGEVALKIVAHNNLIGRIIGKGGATIKKVMDDTNTKVMVSSVNDVNSFNLERVITIKGAIEDISRAESAISTKLRQSYESDLQTFAPQSAMFPGLHPMAMMSTGAGGPQQRGERYGPMSGGPPPPMYGGQQGPGYPPMYPTAFGSSAYDNFEETVFMYIPNYSVGAIIGTKGSHIRNIIRFSGASLKIEDQPNAPISDSPSPNPNEVPERKVTIVGTPEAQWKAQYLIFEKIRDEYGGGYDDVKLTVELVIPSSHVGRLIGKGGQNVRDLQRSTGAAIKLPQQGTHQSQDEDACVQIAGQFYSVQSAQRRVRSMVHAAQGSGRRSASPGMMAGR